MAILVSGASGFLGSRLVSRLVSEHYDVIAIARCSAPSEFVHHPNVRWLVRDIAEDGLNAMDIATVDAVVHLAGATLAAGKDEHLFFRANEQTTVRLFQALSDRTDRFIFASSQVVYGDARHLAVTEAFPLQTTGSAYACSKLNSENWLRWFQSRHGGQYLSLRFCGFIDGGGIVDYLIDTALIEAPIKLFDYGKVCRDYLPSSAATDVLMAALNYNGPPGFHPINIGSGQALSAHDLAKLVCFELQSTSRIELLANPAPQGHFVFSIEKAKSLFDFQPGSLIEAVKQYTHYKKARLGH